MFTNAVPVKECFNSSVSIVHMLSLTIVKAHVWLSPLLPLPSYQNIRYITYSYVIFILFIVFYNFRMKTYLLT